MYVHRIAGWAPQTEPAAAPSHAETKMGSLRIQGVVRLAQRVRRELEQPVSAARQAHLREVVADALAQVQRIVARHGTTIAHLPAPTRRACHFLANLTFNTTAPAATAPHIPPPGTVTLVGLKTSWELLLDRLAQASTPEERAALYGSIASASARIERDLQASGTSGAQLTPTSRMIRGWLAYFGQRENFDAYTAAVGRARPVLTAALARQTRFQPPVVVQLRVIRGLYRVRGLPNATRVALPTPMITFSTALFAALADSIFGRGARQPLLEAAAGEAYQAVQAEVEALEGLAEQTAGVHHDLDTTFRRVNEQCFASALTRPRLTWSRTFTGRVFGHYDPLRDTVMISCTLDHPDVPAFVLDFVMYHELLHKQLGVDWRNGRAAAHTAEFRAAERRFGRYPEAAAVLRRIATEQ